LVPSGLYFLLILRKIFKIVATRCQILTLKCTKIDFRWAPPQTPLGELTVLPRSLAGFKGPTSKGRGREARPGMGGGEGGEEGGVGWSPPFVKSKIRHWHPL